MRQSKKIFTKMLLNNWGGISHKELNLYLSSSNINELLEEYREEIAEDEAIEENLYENAVE